MSHDVFISYSSSNMSTAFAICHVLEEHKIKCWIAPRDIPGGADYGDVIDRAIFECKVFLLVFSGAAVSSQWVRGVVNIAFSEGKPIVSYRIDDTELSGAMRLKLNQMHWLDAYPDAESKFDELVDTVNRLVSDGFSPTVVMTSGSAAQSDCRTVSNKADRPDGGKRPDRKKYWRIVAIVAVVVAVVSIVSDLYFGSVRRASDDTDISGSINSVDTVSFTEKAAVVIESDSMRVLRYKDSLTKVDNERSALRNHNEEMSRKKRTKDSLDKAAKEQFEERRRQEEIDKNRKAEERKRNEAAASQETSHHSASDNSQAATLPESDVAVVENPAKKDYENAVPLRTYKVGDYYEQNGKCGVVFEVDKSGSHGKIVGFEEFPDNQWYVLFDSQNYSYNIKVGAVSESDGRYNQKIIMAVSSWSQRFPAFYLCIKSGGEEWYIPAIEELRTLMLNKKVREAVNATLRERGGIIIGSSKKNSWYWSSTEENANHAYFVDVNMGVWNYYNKQAHGNVRIISVF